MTTDQRLAKYLAWAGVASRRHSEDLVASRKVTVNGKTVTDPAHLVGGDDLIACDGRTIVRRVAGDLVYVMLHKPLGVVSTMAPGNEKGLCLADLVQLPTRVHPVGRLDRDSSGLLLITNDGDLTLRLTHPRQEVEKEYLVKLQRPLFPRDIEKIRRGVLIDERPVRVQTLESARGGRLRIVICEGRNRIVRRLFGEIGGKVLELKRVRIGTLILGRLGIGRWRKLTAREIERLKEAAQYEDGKQIGGARPAVGGRRRAS